MTVLTEHEALLKRVGELVAEDSIRSIIDETANLVNFLTEVNEDVITENKEGLAKAQSQLAAFQSKDYKSAVELLVCESFSGLDDNQLRKSIENLELNRALNKAYMAMELQLETLSNDFVNGDYVKPVIH